MKRGIIGLLVGLVVGALVGGLAVHLNRPRPSAAELALDAIARDASTPYFVDLTLAVRDVRLTGMHAQTVRGTKVRAFDAKPTSDGVTVSETTPVGSVEYDLADTMASPRRR